MSFKRKKIGDEEYLWGKFATTIFGIEKSITTARGGGLNLLHLEGAILLR